MIHINEKEKALINSETGELVRPSCFDSLAPYYSYLVARKHQDAGQRMLEEVFKGEKYITKMVENAQKRGVAE